MIRPEKRSDVPSPESVDFSTGLQSKTLSLKAPAKINWFLQILRKRKDGYHDIMSLMQCVSLFDELIFEHADSITVESEMDIPACDNLIYKAASLLKQSVSFGKGARITVKKQIPSGAGLGGGSSDAAWTLYGLNTLWDLGLKQGELISIGARLGSDIPFFFHAPAALVEARGDVVRPLKVESSFTILLVKPEMNISTAWAYNAYDECRNRALTKKPVDIKLFCRALRKQDFLSLANLLFNDFEAVIVRRCPAVGKIKQELIEAGAEASLMSGSGPTVYGVFRSLQEAERAREVMNPHWCRIAQTLV